jgi:hypothetical protein
MIDSLLQPFDWIGAFPVLALLPPAALQVASYATRRDTPLARLTKDAWLVSFVYALVTAWAVLLDPTQVAPDIRFVDAALTIATIAAFFSRHVRPQPSTRPSVRSCSASPRTGTAFAQQVTTSPGTNESGAMASNTTEEETAESQLQ